VFVIGQELLALVFLFLPTEKNRLVKNVLLEKEGQKQTAVQKEYDRRRKCAVAVLHLLLREIDRLFEQLSQDR